MMDLHSRPIPNQVRLKDQQCPCSCKTLETCSVLGVICLIQIPTPISNWLASSVGVLTQNGTFNFLVGWNGIHRIGTLQASRKPVARVSPIPPETSPRWEFSPPRAQEMSAADVYTVSHLSKSQQEQNSVGSRKLLLVRAKMFGVSLHYFVAQVQVNRQLFATNFEPCRENDITEGIDATDKFI